MRLYNIAAINEKQGWQVTVTAYPMPHHEACVMLKKFTQHPARRLMLVEAS